MSDISKITVGGVQYDIKDTVARSQSGGAQVHTFNVSVPTTSWTANGTGYKKTIAVTGMLETYNPTCNVVLNTTNADTRALQLEAYSLITMITTAADSITIYCDGEKPATALTLSLEAVA